MEEKKIIATELADEIKAILKDFFVAKINKRGNEVDMEFLNGQSFTVTVMENHKRE